MKLKTIAASAALLVAFGAHAGDVDWGTHPTSPVLVGAAVTGNFLDTYSFSLASAADVTSSVLSFGNTLGGSYSVWSYGTDGMFGTADDSQLGLWGMSALPGPATNHLLSLTAGSYYYAVGGRALSGGAAYALSSTAVAAPVPEPETYALLGAGLGIIGFVASRRRRDY